MAAARKPSEVWIVVNGMSIICGPGMKLDEHDARNKVENEQRMGNCMEAITVEEYEWRYNCALTL